MAESSSFDVEEGDLILLGTDGLFDNMNEDMILDCLSKMKVLYKTVFSSLLLAAHMSFSD